MASRFIKRGSIVLVRYPFTDLTSAKVRPAVVLTPDRYLSRMDDIIFLFISSVMPPDLVPTDFVLSPAHPSFSATGLKFPSVFRAHKLAVLQKSLALRLLGELDELLMAQINACLIEALGLSGGPATKD
jgi:mRNA interferase MazF